MWQSPFGSMEGQQGGGLRGREGAVAGQGKRDWNPAELAPN